MTKIHNLANLTDIQKLEKITIKKGEIIRTYVWKDSKGNEYEKIGNQFIPKYLFFASRMLSSSPPIENDTLLPLFYVIIFVFIILFVIVYNYFLNKKKTIIYLFWTKHWSNK